MFLFKHIVDRMKRKKMGGKLVSLVFVGLYGDKAFFEHVANQVHDPAGVPPFIVVPREDLRKGSFLPDGFRHQTIDDS